LTLRIELSGQLLPGSPRHLSLTLAHPMTVQEVALSIGLDPEEVGLVVIDGVQHEMEDSVPEEGRLCFFPPLSGG
jgi:hypothetical protein